MCFFFTKWEYILVASKSNKHIYARVRVAHAHAHQAKAKIHTSRVVIEMNKSFISFCLNIIYMPVSMLNFEMQIEFFRWLNIPSNFSFSIFNFLFFFAARFDEVHRLLCCRWFFSFFLSIFILNVKNEREHARVDLNLTVCPK